MVPLANVRTSCAIDDASPCYGSASHLQDEAAYFLQHSALKASPNRRLDISLLHAPRREGRMLSVQQTTASDTAVKSLSRCCPRWQVARLVASMGCIVADASEALVLPKDRGETVVPADALPDLARKEVCMLLWYT